MPTSNSGKGNKGNVDNSGIEDTSDSESTPTAEEQNSLPNAEAEVAANPRPGVSK